MSALCHQMPEQVRVAVQMQSDLVKRSKLETEVESLSKEMISCKQVIHFTYQLLRLCDLCLFALP